MKMPSFKGSVNYHYKDESPKNSTTPMSFYAMSSFQLIQITKCHQVKNQYQIHKQSNFMLVSLPMSNLH